MDRSGTLAPDGSTTTATTVATVTTTSAAETRALAARLAGVAAPGDVVCLIGALGAGKTRFAQGFAAGLGVTDEVVSPTFVLLAEHAGPIPLFHLDLYRLEGPSAVTAVVEDGLLDERERTGVTLIEWADRLGPAMPLSRLEVTIDGAGEEPRTIALRATDRRHARYVAVLS